jgi:hypothetical protein
MAAGVLIAMILSAAYASSLRWSEQMYQEALNYAPFVGEGDAGVWASVAAIFGEETAEAQ